MSLQLMPQIEKPALAGRIPTSWEMESARQVQRRLMKTDGSTLAILQSEGRCRFSGFCQADDMTLVVARVNAMKKELS